MTNRAITTRHSRLEEHTHIFHFYQNAELTDAVTNWAEFVSPFACRIVDVIAHSNAAGSGGTSTIMDVHINGTTIYTTQGNRPTLLAADDGMYTEAAPPDIDRIDAGDIVTVDVDQVATTGPTVNSIQIVVVGV